MKKYILLSLSVMLFFTACSNKKYFEPENVDNSFEAPINNTPSKIRSMNRAGATLEDGQILTLDGISKFKLPEGFDFINVSFDGKILATNYKDKILVGNEEIKTKDVVVAASLKDDKLALVYSNNSIELLDINTKKTLFKEYESLSLANDTRIANPHFMGNLILFPTLNGKVVIVSAISYESVKNISVDPQGDINNIIFLDVLDSSQTLIVASPNKIVSISPKEIIAKDYELRDIISHDESIYIATIDGQIMKLSSNLEVISQKKFKYAKIYALAFTNSLYAVESQGFIINIDENFTSEKIYDFDFDDEKKVIAIKDKIYYDSNVLTLP